MERRLEMGDEAYRAHRAAIVRRYRSDPVKRRHNSLITQARGRALERLGEMHPEELDRYIDVERALLGLPPRVF